ncbi:MAG: hypothetical protein QXP59_02625 [Saccharolobus sp.]
MNYEKLKKHNDEFANMLAISSTSYSIALMVMCFIMGNILQPYIMAESMQFYIFVGLFVLLLFGGNMIIINVLAIIFEKIYYPN